jgi:hypothetical protein
MIDPSHRISFASFDLVVYFALNATYVIGVGNIKKFIRLAMFICSNGGARYSSRNI